jgi:hypothetical protein
MCVVLELFLRSSDCWSVPISFILTQEVIFLWDRLVPLYGNEMVHRGFYVLPLYGFTTKTATVLLPEPHSSCYSTVLAGLILL